MQVTGGRARAGVRIGASKPPCLPVPPPNPRPGKTGGARGGPPRAGLAATLRGVAAELRRLQALLDEAEESVARDGRESVHECQAGAGAGPAPALLVGMRFDHRRNWGRVFGPSCLAAFSLKLVPSSCCVVCIVHVCESANDREGQGLSKAEHTGFRWGCPP